MSWVTVIALTRTQLIAGNRANGFVLSGQPQGVIAGSGITISPGGIISVNASTAVGLMRLNNTTAYNAYVWPNGRGLAGEQLTSDGSGNLSWSEPDGILWTAKGQLIVGTGVRTETILSAGANTSILVADSGSASGLNYTSNISTAALMPVGNSTTQRPTAPLVGQVRYNSDDNEFEGYGGSPAAWGPFSQMPTGAGGDKIFYLNNQIVTTSYTLPSAPVAKNSVSAGPITIASGVTVTVPTGQSWSIV